MTVGTLCALFLNATPSGFLRAQEVEDQVAQIVSEATEERIEQAMEGLLDDIESRLSEDSLRIQTDHWLVMAEADVFVQLEEGLPFRQGERIGRTWLSFG